MWILSWLPSWVFHATLVLGIAGIVASWFLKFIPVIDKYSFPIQAISIVIAIASVWYEGGVSNEAAWQAKVKELEQKVAIAETKSKIVNTVIQDSVVTKIKVVKEQTDANNQYISETVAKELDADCKLTNASVVLHNSASQNEVAGRTGDTVSGTSDVKASELITTVNENYGTYYQLVEQVKGWQQWYKDQKKIFDELQH